MCNAYSYFIFDGISLHLKEFDSMEYPGNICSNRRGLKYDDEEHKGHVVFLFVVNFQKSS